MVPRYHGGCTRQVVVPQLLVNASHLLGSRTVKHAARIGMTGKDAGASCTRAQGPRKDDDACRLDSLEWSEDDSASPRSSRYCRAVCTDQASLHCVSGRCIAAVVWHVASCETVANAGSA